MKRSESANARERAWGVDTRRARRARDEGQTSFADCATWGGPRKGAGRKPAARAKVLHRKRPRHRAWCPLHITLRRAEGLPSLRSAALHAELVEAVRRAQRDDFRIAEYSVQSDHLHAVVEALDGRALANGMRTFASSSSARINRVLARQRGAVWAGRYHRRDLESPRDVRNVLVYVLANHLKHGITDVGLVDPCSSGPWFTGWMHYRDERPRTASPTAAPQTYLLDRGWHDGVRFIHLGEVPRALRAK